MDFFYSFVLLFVKIGKGCISIGKQVACVLKKRTWSDIFQTDANTKSDENCVSSEVLLNPAINGNRNVYKMML